MAMGLLKLEELFNSKSVVVSDAYGSGEYRVRVRFEPEGKVIESTWEFKVF